MSHRPDPTNHEGELNSNSPPAIPSTTMNTTPTTESSTMRHRSTNKQQPIKTEPGQESPSKTQPLTKSDQTTPTHLKLMSDINSTPTQMTNSRNHTQMPNLRDADATTAEESTAASTYLGSQVPITNWTKKRSSSSSSLLSSTTPSMLPISPVLGFGRRLFALIRRIVQAVICVLTYLSCGCFLCGGCCWLPCKKSTPPLTTRRMSSRRGSGIGGGGAVVFAHHRRRRRRRSLPTNSLEPLHSTHASTNSSSTNVHHSADTADDGGDAYESWTESDDSEFEYEPETLEAAERRVTFSACKMVMVFLLVVCAYVFLFVRVIPTSSSRGAELGLEFNFFRDLIPPMNVPVPIPEQLQSSFNAILGESSRPGLIARQDGLRAHFPIVFVPGIVSTGLEVWEGEPCARPYFRQRWWGSTLMIRSILLDSRCWLRHMSLDGWSGLDPDGIKLRPAAGLEAADYLVSNYWIWAKIIQNLADIGYDGNSMFMAPYDWRLSFKHLQLRDYYYTKLKTTIEIAKLANHNRKVVLVAHSMGGCVLHYFLKWVESPAGGNGGTSWVADNIESLVGIGVPWLGVPKVYSSLFSGEMKDTAELAPFLDYWRQRVVFSQEDVLNIMRTFRSLPGMYPKGGNVIWGDEESAPDDILIPLEQGLSIKEAEAHLAEKGYSYFGQFLTFTTNSIPWPFPNITQVVEEGERTHQFAPRWSSSTVGSGTTNTDSNNKVKLATLEEWTEKLKELVTIEPGEATTNDLNLEDAAVLLAQVAWPDIAFNDELYSHGFGIMNSSATNSTQPEKLLNFDPSSPDHDLGDQRYWANPLESPLPMAPDLKIFCFYGVGRDSERGYVYGKANAISTLPKISELLATHADKLDRLRGATPSPSPNERQPPTPSHRHQEDIDETDELLTTSDTFEQSTPSSQPQPHQPSDEKHIGGRSPSIGLFGLNTSYHLSSSHIRSGVKMSDGDGTVPLLSLGYMCVDGWKQKRWNPSQARIIVREYQEVNQTLPMLRSSTSVDHVDIMGNSQVIHDLLYIAGIRLPTETPHTTSTQSNASPSTANATASSSTGPIDGSPTPISTHPTDEQATWRRSDEAARFQGEPETDSTNPHPPSSTTSASTSIPSGSSSSSGDQVGSESPRSRASNSPIGDLTWMEVTERIYSQIRVMSQRIHHRWENRTGTKLE